jgi:uncharacterized membrane protein YdbT with pleckstrin-like domain
MELHPGEQIVFEGHPSWRALLAFYIYGLVGTAIVVVILVLAASTAAAVVAGVVLVVLVLLVGFLRRMSTTYMVSNQRLIIRRGFLSKHVQQTRLDRVQNVNTDQTLLQRMLFVGTVDFDTAGTDDADFRFVGIGKPARVVKEVDVALREASERG